MNLMTSSISLMSSDVSLAGANTLLSASDWIQLIGVVVGLITSIVAIVISIETLNQNNKMIEESNRPYILVSKEVVAINSPQEYFLIKNYGPTGAYITNIETNIDLSKLSFGSLKNRNPFAQLNNSFLAPNQSICAPFISEQIDSDVLVVSIDYKSESKSYHSDITIYLKSAYNLIHTKSTSKDKLEDISRTLQESIIKNL